MIELSFPAVLLLLGAGALLIAIEVFVTPGMHVKGLLGLACVAGAVVLAFAQHGPAKGSLVLGLALLVLASGGWVAKVTFGRRLVLRQSLPADLEVESDLAHLVGERGLAVSPLRPSGMARFGERRVDVTSEPEFLEAGTAVVVVAVDGSRVRVEPAAD